VAEVWFTVDPEGLDALRAQLAAIQSGMQNIGNEAGAYDPLDLGPNADVWNELQSFHNNWSDGLAMIGHNLQALLGLLASAAAGYRQTDEQIAQSATPPGAT
jgi:hypothetical protein